MVNIYSLSDPITGEIRYVGKTIHNIQRRLYFHIHDSKSRNYHNANWIRSLATTQLQPIVELLDVVENENWEFWEQYWICQCKSWGFRLTNHTSGGGGVVGIFVSEETNKKKSETMKKKICFW